MKLIDFLEFNKFVKFCKKLQYFTKLCHKTLTLQNLFNYNIVENKGDFMKIEEKNWSKTLLIAYGHLETICGAIDKTVLDYGLKSSAINCDVEYLAKKMISLIERKKFLINIKVLVDNALNRISDAEAKVLILKYIDNLPSNIASEVLKVSMRTYFRKLNIALENFAKILIFQGYSTAKFFDMFKNEKWILEIFDSYYKKEKKDEKFESINLLSLALNTLSNKRYSAMQR